MRRFGTIIILAVVLVFSCQKDDLLPSKGYEDVTLINLSGFDGCGYVFSLKGNMFLEPQNLSDFLTDLNEGDKFWIKYRLAKDQASYCMIGDVITLVELRSQ